MSAATKSISLTTPAARARIAAVIRNELTLALHNRMTQFTIGVTTLLFILIPLGLVYAMGDNGFLKNLGNSKRTDPQMLATVQQAFPQLAGLSPDALVQALLLSSMQSLFLIVPLMVPMIIAVYSIIGEKQTRSLEAVLATPVETSELLAGKCLAAALPGILSSWIAYLLFAVLAIPGLSTGVMSAVILRLPWLLALLLIAPAGAFLAVILGLIVSSRASDPQSAQQVAAIIVLPVVALMIGQIAGVVQLSVLLVVLGAAVFLAIDAGLLALAVRLFQRETILTRWK